MRSNIIGLPLISMTAFLTCYAALVRTTSTCEIDESNALDVRVANIETTSQATRIQVVVINKSDAIVHCSKWTIRGVLKHRCITTDRANPQYLLSNAKGVGTLESPPPRDDLSDTLTIPANYSVTLDFVFSGYIVNEDVAEIIADTGVIYEGPIRERLYDNNALTYDIESVSIPIVR